ncbi:4'-phosphopantetheinyl transferase [Amycolatopsis bartoniae]|uniref:4'-phosphopantetheinyl transferase family protein n=1 Tax=Amycolatopsis bartoniae TaxID=941986 RepID=UPI001190D3FD|nr:4'-phosphopantetheinyl transferase superfamily protein [Amycolatopsis bartoniae]MBB2934882.1 4'-phosphopantetheinyl transferase [Amycolatopsis bartoniae]TVT00768.1 4'-phosphopantetheinyl transferase superfamily protein [Amycolatopsis bartoniae]
MIECAIWWAAPLPNDPEYLTLLDEPEQGRHRAYRLEIDQRRFLTGRVMAKTVLGERLGLSAQEVRFDATCDDCGKPHGKPRIKGVEFSISHSGDRIGLAVTTAPVGLDVETENRKADDSLISYALNEAEQKALNGLSAAERASAFFQYWTRKEALMKATGKGLKIPLQSITLDGARLAASTHAALNPNSTWLQDLTPGEGYRAAVAILTTENVTTTETNWHP